MTLRTIAVLGAVAVLCGCANRPVPTGMQRVQDEDRMAAIERAAARNGVKVYWINGPTKLVPTVGS